MERAPNASPRRIRRATGLALVACALAVLAGALWMHPWARSPGPAGGEAAVTALPDPPAPEEQALLARVASARADDPTPARLLGDHDADAARPFAALWAYALALRARAADVPATLGLARALEQARFHDAAIARLRQVLAREPGQPQATAQLAELYLRTGRPEAALPVVRGGGPAFAGSKDGAVLEGQVRQALGDARGAKAAYWRAVAQDTNDASVRHRIGLLALSQGELYEAQQALGAARIFAPASPRYDVDLGRAFAAGSRREEWSRALELYEAAIRRNVRYGPAHYEAGVWYLRRSRWREAIDRFQIAVDADPGDAEAHERLAQALEAVGRRAEAHRHRGLAYDARDLRIAALQEYQAWAALDRANPEAALQVAQSCFEINRTAEARAILEKARLRFPRDAAIRERLIAFYLLGLDRAQARRLCQEWLREEPGSPEVLWLLGRAAADEQQSAEAVRLYEQALAKEPDNPQWLGTLGETLLTQDKAPGSWLLAPGRDAGGTASRFADSRARSQEPGARSGSEASIVPRAVAALASAATRSPDEPRWRLALAQGLQRLGRLDDARRQALRALDLDPRQSQAYILVIQLARQARATGPLALYADLVRAVEDRLREETALRRATWERPRDPRAYAALAGFLMRTGDLAAAEGQLTESLRLRPDWPELRARLAMIRRLREVL
jgi:tetratricopeptide (TPR) repeat protein